MAILTLRLVKGSPLTNAEVDANFTSLDQNKVQLGGDLGGTTSTPLVAKLQGNSLSSSAPVLGQALVWDGQQWTPGASLINLVPNDISIRFDNITQVFQLKNGYNLITASDYGDERDLEVVVNGRRLEPWIQEQFQYGPWFSIFDAGRSSSYRMRNGKIIFYAQPRTKTTGFIKINTKSTTRQKRKYPLSPNNIAFGD